MNRRQLRDYTFKLLFHTNFYSAGELAKQIDNYLEECMYPQEGQLLLTQPERQQLLARWSEIMGKLTQIDEAVAAASEGWKLNRMNKVDLTIIRLAYYEMHFDEEVPDKVAVNEAVELAKRYGGDESPQFVNGILAKLIRKENL